MNQKGKKKALRLTQIVKEDRVSQKYCPKEKSEPQQTSQEIIKAFPSKMLDMTNRTMKRLDKVAQSIKLNQPIVGLEDNNQPLVGLEELAINIHKQIFTQVTDYQQQSNKMLAECIRGVPASDIQLKKIQIPEYIFPMQSRVDKLKQLIETQQNKNESIQ